MESGSAFPADGATAGRIRSSAANLCSDSQALIAEMREAFNMIKGVAIDLETENRSDMVKQLENAVVELVQTYEDCLHHSAAIQSIGNTYKPGPEFTDFNKLLKHEFMKFKASSSSVSHNHPLLRQFREAVWNVHHEGQPLPGEEQEDLVVTSTQSNILNLTCPLSGKAVTELADPVRSMDCKHIYEKNAIMAYIRSKANAICPIAGCPKRLRKERVTCDLTLHFDIEEVRAMGKQTARTDVIEDFTELDDVESE